MVIISTLTVIKLIRNLYLYVLFINHEYYNRSGINGVKLKFLTYEHFAEMNVVEQH